MANGNSTVLLHQQHCHRLTNDIASADYDTIFARDGMTAAFDQFNDTCRGTGQEALRTCVQVAYVHRVEAIHVLIGADGHDDFSVINMFGHRHLNQNAVYTFICIQFIDQLQQFFLCGCLGQHMRNRLNAYGCASLFFIAYIYLGSGVIADQNNSQTGFDALFFQCCCFFCRFCLDFCGNQFAIDQLCFHLLLSPCQNFLTKIRTDLQRCRLRQYQYSVLQVF